MNQPIELSRLDAEERERILKDLFAEEEDRPSVGDCE